MYEDRFTVIAVQNSLYLMRNRLNRALGIFLWVSPV
jgi:hypothetical protein